jgi:hypothetical protein
VTVADGVPDTDSEFVTVAGGVCVADGVGECVTDANGEFVAGDVCVTNGLRERVAVADGEFVAGGWHIFARV